MPLTVANDLDDHIGRKDDFRLVREDEGKIVLAADADWVWLR
jgi:hypothetical protein